jgi:cytochrome c oxidase subunit 6a
MAVALVNGKLRWDAHWEHVAHDTPREDKVEYAYQNIRTKNYFWGDGDKVRQLPGSMKHTRGQAADIL